MRKTLSIAAAAVALSASVLVMVAQAKAATDSESMEDAVSSSLTASSITRTTDDPVCQAARAKTDTPGPCATQETITATAGRPLTAAEIQKFGSMKTADGTTVAAAAASSKVYIRSWHQEVHGLYYVNWKERHEGKWLYNGSIAWVNDRSG